MSGCENCGSCGGCGTCRGALELTEAEIRVLEQLGQIPFWPVARKADSMEPFLPEAEAWGMEQSSLILQCLEKKELISIDYDAPLKGVDASVYGSYPIRGSMALTARGQQVLELLEIQGIH